MKPYESPHTDGNTRACMSVCLCVRERSNSLGLDVMHYRRCVCQSQWDGLARLTQAGDDRIQAAGGFSLWHTHPHTPTQTHTHTRAHTALWVVLTDLANFLPLVCSWGCWYKTPQNKAGLLTTLNEWKFKKIKKNYVLFISKIVSFLGVVPSLKGLDKVTLFWFADIKAASVFNQLTCCFLLNYAIKDKKRNIKWRL